ncbi:MAG TPA: ACT domain-containing protein [Bacteroidaceae bacterium]|nr:ACT domain-containing protein [Bacteroidaceae bacterium]
MLIKQISVFLENKCGRFAEIARILGENNINMTAFTVSENEDFGIARFIVNNTEKALAILKEHSYGVSTTEVVYLKCDNVPGAMAKAMAKLSKAGVFVEYMYAFADKDSAHVIIRPDNVQLCDSVLN